MSPLKALSFSHPPTTLYYSRFTFPAGHIAEVGTFFFTPRITHMIR
jgi:hypothetical protein